MPAIRISPRPRFDQPVLPLLIALLSCSVSVVLTVKFCRELRAGDGAMILVTIGLAWELAKFNFAPMGLRYLIYGRGTGRLGGLSLIALALVLIAGSIVASLGYLVTSDKQEQQSAVVNSRAYQDLQHQLASVDQRIDVLSQAVAADVAQEYRTRALNTAKDIQALTVERRNLADRLTLLETTSAPASSSQFFMSLGSQFPGDASTNASRVRFASHAVVAVMLELIGIASLALLHSQRTSIASSDRTENTSRYEQAKALVAKGEVSPTLRALQASMRASQQTVERYLSAMQDEGMLLRVGRRYKLAA